jgi:hypothetical protein
LVIESYSFGRIAVGGREYNSDVIIFPDRIEPSWRRRSGHSLGRDDLGAVIDFGPRLLIVGTGAYGVMKVPGDTVRFLRGLGIEVIADKTAAAVERYNAEAGPDTVAALHLTC